MLLKGRRMVARCGGGLGYRILNLIAALYIAKKLNIDLHIIWVPTEICDCDFHHIFENSEFILNKNIFNTHEYYMDLKRKDLFDTAIVNPKTQPRKKTRRCVIISSQILQLENIAKSNCILYQSSALPPFISVNDAVDVLSSLKIKSHIIKKALAFINEYKITTKDKGYHVRLTDSFTNINRAKESIVISDIIQNTSTRYFVCSCDIQFENKISNYKNVLLRRNKSYPHFIDCEDTLLVNQYCDRIKECNTEVHYPYNYVNSDAVIDAFIDILILSRTDIIQQRPLYSNFREVATYYSYVFFSDTFLKYNNKYIKIDI